MVTLNLEEKVKRLKTELDKNHNDKTYNEYIETCFLLNKQNVNVILKGEDKYWKAMQCMEFTMNVTDHGFRNTKADQIKYSGISFNKHSINLGSSPYNKTLIRFKKTEDMFNFIHGYNVAMEKSYT